MSDLVGFSVVRRNFGHWDIFVRESRVYTIRGGPGKYSVNEQCTSARSYYFKTVGACMSFICDTLMYELIVADGQTPQVIEAWNV